jgi:DNA-binding beta-propeller fold protein YncE
MNKSSTNIVSRFLGLRLGAPILAAGMLAAISLPWSSVYAAPHVSAVIPTAPFQVDGMAVAPNGTTLYALATTPGGGFFSQLIVVNTQFNTITATSGLFNTHFPFQHLRGASTVAENHKGTLIFVVHFLSDAISVISEATNTAIDTFLGPVIGPNPIGIAITPNGKQLWVANSGTGPSFNNGTVQVIDIATPGSASFGTAITLINTGGSPNTVTFNSTGTRAFVLNGGAAGFVDEINTTTFNIIHNNIGLNPAVINFPNPLAMAIAKSNASLFIASGFGFLNDVAVPSGLVPNITNMFSINPPPPADQQQGQVLLSPSGKTVYVAGIGSSSVRVASTVTDLSRKPIILAPLLLPLPVPTSNPYFMALSPTGTTLYVSNFNNFVAAPFGGSTSISVVTGLTP